MADPITWMIAGTAVSAIGQLNAASNAADASRYNAQLAERNAIIADQNATLARQQAVAQSEQQRRQATRQMGAMRAGYANSGVQMEGSVLDVLAASSAQAELDTLNVIYNGELRARGFGNEAEGQRATAALDRARADNQETQGLFNAGSSLLMGGARISGAGGFGGSGGGKLYYDDWNWGSS